MKIGIFGGTFNPPHIGHERAAKAAVAQLQLDILLVIPVGIPPHKRLPPDSPSAEIRLMMTQNAFSEILYATVSHIEVENTQPSYTIETVDKIKKTYPNAKLFLLMGTDMFLSLESWKAYDALLPKIIPTVFPRNDDDLDKISTYSDYLRNQYGCRTEIIKNIIVPISSSELRHILPLRDGVGYITDTNYAYIISSRLYDAKPDWDWLRKKAYEMLDSKRIPHVRACEDAAVLLAEHWGVNEDDAREAAILHDITKRLNTAEHLKILKAHHIVIDALKKEESKLLHAKSGALLAKSMFGISHDVEDAISCHTTGKAEMSLLAKVLYLADYIEATRDFPGVDLLRCLAFEDIDEAMVLGLEMTISDLSSRSISPDAATLAAISDLKSQP
ncbi:MAG: nicotinate (nicotinamide) nucleotide adenylyltransferase [Oscillospiraceae bacterium]|nr:nicotinate (nicotinamide) nucleotide adenylyltransferase [Oscillospiraceae bacterium]